MHHKTRVSTLHRKNKIDQERGNRRRKSKSSPLMGMNQFLNDQPAMESSYTREQNTYRSLRRNARGGRSNNVNGSGNTRNSRNVRRGRRLSRKGRNHFSISFTPNDIIPTLEIHRLDQKFLLWQVCMLALLSAYTALVQF